MLHFVLSKKKEAQIRLRLCIGWSASLLFATPQRQLFLTTRLICNNAYLRIDVRKITFAQFHAKIKYNFPEISYLSKTPKITFNSYNYNFFLFLSLKYYFYHFLFTLTFSVDNFLCIYYLAMINKQK